METVMEYLKYIFLGLLQGFTEPIPISSSGHVMLAQHYLGIELEGLSFEVLVNFASLLAVLFIYRSDLMHLASGSWSYVRTRRSEDKNDFLFVVYLVIGTIPAVLVGLTLKDVIADRLTGVAVIGATLILTGIALWMIRKLTGHKKDGDLSAKDAVIVGLAQAVALVPGISRSGATIIAAMARGMKRDTALRFSFFLYIPVSVGSMVLEGGDLFTSPDFSARWLPYLLAFIASLITSYYSLRWFMGVMKRGKLHWFALYCFVVGAVVLLVQ